MDFKKYLKNKFNKLRDVTANSLIYYIYYNLPLNKNLVYIESQNGEALNGNLLRICEELSKPEYNFLKIIIRVKPNSKNKIQTLVKHYNLQNVRLVSSTLFSLCYMERAKFLFCDAGIQTRYVKREGQIYVNTWHGTPFKVMGKRVVAERHSIGNLQRNFLMCDYLLFPNRYMQKIFIRDYMLENLWQGKSLLSGYPRNTIFFNAQRREIVKKELDLVGKKVFAYLPTYRGSFFDKKNNKQIEEIQRYLGEIDKNLKDDQVLILKFHLYNNQSIDCSRYKHIINFPDNYETYDVLNTVDCLITDYSSVFFDFAVTGKKIVLFAYDEEEYFADRGVYFSFKELPFPKVTTVEALIKEINIDKNYDDSIFVNRFCPYEADDVTKKICKLVIDGIDTCVTEPAPYNGKENVLIYAGNLAKNGITTSLFNLLNSIDLEKRNYFITFYRSSVKTPERTLVIPDDINYMPIATDPFFTLFEKMAHRKFIRCNIKIVDYSKYLKRAFKREISKQFWHVKFSHVIQFDGYTKNAMLMFDTFDCDKTIYVHSDMLTEIKTRGNQSLSILHCMYNRYKNVAIVSEDIFTSTTSISEKECNIRLAHNFFDFNGIIKKSLEPIEVQKETEISTYSVDGIVGILNCGGKKIITIGRFSPEKGHIRLMDAFNEYWLQHKDAQLIIIGGPGIDYNKELRYKRKLNSWKNITFIKTINNPMPILRKCDLFILSSFYEGLGLVLMEAAALKIPCISTDIVGPRKFMKEHGGYLVEDSMQGVLQGMIDSDNNKVPVMNIDFAAYNKKCLEEFENLFRSDYGSNQYS